MNTIYEHILLLFDKDDKDIIMSLVHSCEQRYHLPINIIIDAIDIQSEKIYNFLFTKKDITIMDRTWSYDKRKTMYDTLKEFSFDIDIKSTIFFSKFLFNTIYINNSSLLPEYKWFAKQLL